MGIGVVLVVVDSNDKFSNCIINSNNDDDDEDDNDDDDDDDDDDDNDNDNDDDDHDYAIVLYVLSHVRFYAICIVLNIL